MINIDINTHPNLYVDYRAGLDFLQGLKFTQSADCKNITLFHIYTEVRTDKELECIKSFLATQNLEKCKLIVWSDYDINDHPPIQPYKKYVDFRVWNPREEAIGTPLENSGWLLADDSKHYMKSGVLRFLATHNYGGIWADMDMIFLNDFYPLLDQEWAYMWGSETDFINHGPCAALMNIHRHSDHALLCLNKMTEAPSNGSFEGSTVLDHRLLAKVYAAKPFTVFPSSFFNTEWLISKTDMPFRKSLLDGFTKINTDKDFLFLEAFAWHWHHSSHKDKKIEKGSKFDLLRDRTDRLLKEKNILS
jgi:hypothetical protein